MPVVFRYQGLTFFFYSNEGDPREPIHIHVRAGGAIAKVWLEPLIGIAEKPWLQQPGSLCYPAACHRQQTPDREDVA